MDAIVRRLIAFRCEGETLAGTLDAAAGTTGLLIVSGGNEIRCGAHRGMAMLAQRLAASGVPVFRYDRRGVGDSTGENGGYASGRADLIAAASAFRGHAPLVTRIVGFGNCDAATTLALFGADAGIDRTILANPWLRDEPDALPPAAAIRARYAAALRDPATWRRLVRGGVDLRKLARGLRKAAAPIAPPAGPVDAIARLGASATIILAKGDATAIAFAEASRRRGLRIETIDTASHSFAGEAGEALEAAIRRALR